MPKRVTVVEVGPRDGFQMENVFIPTDLKIEVIDTLAASGVSKIEATSFVSPKVIPQMADSLLVMRRVRRRPEVLYTALVPNMKGAQRAIEAGVDAMRVVVCASETYNQRNVGMTVADSLKNCQEIFAAGQRSGVPVEAVIGLAFGCPLEGEILEDRLLDLTKTLAKMGYAEISIADTVGLANPAEVRRRMERIQQELPQVHSSLHLHNTRGLGLANVLAGLEAGTDTFDSSLGGLGGCPVVPGGSGNISTEDLVNMLEEMEIQTGIDIEQIIAASCLMETFLMRQLPSYVLRSGTPVQLHRRMAAVAPSPGCTREASGVDHVTHPALR